MLGGPAFNDPRLAAEWVTIPGLTAIVGAEADFTLPVIDEDVVRGKDLAAHEGVLPARRPPRPSRAAAR